MAESSMCSGRLALVLAGCLALAAPAAACDVPVFRYALERWPADDYDLVVFSSGEPDAKLRGALARLEEARAAGTNITVHIAEPSVSDEGSAVLSCRRPGGPPLVLWSGALTPESADAIVDSPARERIAELLTGGVSAVWVLLQCGDAERDERARALLVPELARAPEMAERMEGSARFYAPAADGEGPALRLDFPLVVVPAADADEELLRAVLRASEPDLLAGYASEPAVFPVFGRGRVLYALVGKGINAPNVRGACAFLAGPCACEIKDSSRGLDLLIQARWDDAISEPIVDDTAAPLTSIGAILELEAEAGADAPSDMGEEGQ